MNMKYERIISTEEAKLQMINRVNYYRQYLKQFQRQTYNETEVRIDFVNPFFKLLGWDVDNEARLPQHLREVVHEASVIVEEDGANKTKKPDYSFRVGAETLFYLETKKPAVDITTDRTSAFQLRRYGWSGNLKISILTNFTDLYIYDCTVRPVENDDIGVALIAHYSYTEYVDKFDEIYSLISKEAAVTGQFEKVFGNITGAYRREPFNEYFLTQIKEWRDMLGADIAARNSSIDNETLNICVQRILNRILFLRICEDRNFEKYETLRKITSYDELKSLFIASDKKYDSGLFAILDEDQYSLSDSVIVKIFQSLYYPNNSYEFSVVDPYIIGQIYELFLDETLEIQKDRTIVSVEKPEAIDSQGAVNTPKNITDFIVEQTLTPLYEGKTISQIRTYRIADICCGSGNFLLSAYEFIVNYYIETLGKSECEAAIRRGDIYLMPGSSNYCLSYKLRRDILINNIWGVDIDPLAVEVTKFSLFLKALEGVGQSEIDAYIAGTSTKILPNLDNNIKNGNSLVDSKFVKFVPSIYQNIGLMNKIKMFDWQIEFCNRKFTAIIGNPPYIRVQNMVRYSPEEYAFYKSPLSGYNMSGSDLLDKYYLFIERALSLLEPDGLLGYVVPHKFMTIKSGEELRTWLSSNGNVKRIFHFGTFQVFKGRSTYTCVLILAKARQAYFDIAFIRDWNSFLYEHAVELDKYPSTYISGQPWSFLPANITDTLNRMRQKCLPLSEYAKIFVGVQTSADKIYIIHAEQEEDATVTFTGKDHVRRKIEKGILRKSVYDARLSCYEKIEANSYIIFPYENVNGKSTLIDKEKFESQYPLAFQYLSDFRTELDKRNMPNRTEENWFAYGRSQSINNFMEGEHLIWPVLSLGANYVYDNEMVVFTGGGNGPFYGLEMRLGIPVSLLYIQAILNHWLMELLVKSKGSTFRGGYYSHGKQYIAQLPVYKIDFSVESDVKIHDKIVSIVQTMMDLNVKKKSAVNTATLRTFQRSIDALHMELNAIIDELYSVHEEKAEE